MLERADTYFRDLIPPYRLFLLRFYLNFLFILCALMLCLHMCLCEVSDLLQLELQTVVNGQVGAGNSNLGPLKGQQKLLTVDLSLQPLFLRF